MRPLLTALLLMTAGAVVRAQELDPAAEEAALLREVEILKQGVAQRKPDEADTAFLQRLFPASFEHGKATRYAWRPSAHGPQLFFSHAQRDELHTEGEGTELFVLDPFRPGRYAVQVLFLEPIGDITNLAAFFFADVNQDGQKELLALVYAEVPRVVLLNVGPGKKERAVGRFSHWQTQIFRYSGRNATGQPRYQPDRTSRPYLNGLRSAAAVRQALAQHPHRPKRSPSKAGK
ncbi:MAG TPA: hypothetical protein VF690_19195 [Hymenobacter sp.]